ncbi:MAG TPA: RNase A-like domain-containing protein [Terriglobales bacterium]|nr:RNase A-like domain-containing protein [Terriglobales bacterium]
MHFRSSKLVAAALLLLSLLVACSRPTTNTKERASSSNRASRHSGARNLANDEEDGGHTLKKHVGLSDRELRERLKREPEISAASSYTDRHTAEDFIGDCLSENDGRIEQWLERDRHPNLVLDCEGDPAWPIGRSLRKGGDTAEPCSRATVVLKWKPRREYYVLTSYPDCR